MVTKARLVCAVVGLALAGPPTVAQQRPGAPKPGVPFTGSSFPAPPQQGQPWQPPAGKLPEKWASAVQELLKEGIVDPRGCEYREVELTCGSSTWGSAGWIVATHAWVIPQGAAEKAGGLRFAVTWDGLIYPLTKVGPAANLKADVEALLAADDKWWKGAVEEGQKKAKENPKFAFAYRPHRWQHAQAESSLVSYQSLLPLKSCTLFILGEGELAERLWNAWKRGTGIEEDRGNPADDPYLIFAREWGWALFDRAVGAHKRGDDVISMLDAAALVELEKAADPMAERRGFQRPIDPGPNRRKMPYFDFGGSAARLLEDETRRVKAGPVERVLDVGLEKFPDQPKRIAALIRDLEVASAEQWSQPGGVSISMSAVVGALVKEGRPAVEPLLDCLANDRRLTRAVGFGRDFFQSRYFITVGGAAFAALQGILQVDHFGPLTEHGYYLQGASEMDQRRAMAEEIRAYFEKSKGRTQQEMWFAVLADENATDRQWLEAAQKIVEPGRASQGDRSRLEGAITINGRLRVLDNEGDRGRPLAGESLRGKQNPSVADLLAQRGDDMAAKAKLQDSFFDEATACELTVCLAKWDLKAAVPAIHRRVTGCRHFTPDRPLHGSQGLQTLARPLTSLFEAGVQAGDEATIDDYVAWLRATPPADFSFFELSVFMPLWRHVENPKLAELARWLFLSEESPWHPIHELKPLNSQEMINSPLVGVPAFRELLKREFNNASPIGEFEVKDGSLTMVAMHASMGSSSEYAPDVELPKVAGKQPLRACDFYAVEISRLEGSPRYELYWPQERRDAVRKDMAKFLDQWGNCFRDHSRRLESTYGPFAATRFSLARLTQPATAGDVAAGRAIFSLGDRPDAQVRTVELKPYPAIGRWKTLQQFRLARPLAIVPPTAKEPLDEQAYKRFPQEVYDREGYLWQAEEIQVGGKWQRYYGFVGAHVIAKVPGEEIELLDKFTDEFRGLR
jgi:hypothetical protein